MELTDSLEYIGTNHILEEDVAIDFLFHHVLDPAVCIYECPVRVFRECQNLPKRFDLIDPGARGYGLGDNHNVRATPETFLTPRDLWHTLRFAPTNQHPVVLDVREPREFRRSHIAEAQSVPLSTLLRDELILAENRPIVLVCRSGRRSRRAAAKLHEMGFSEISLLEGGMQAWESAGFLTAVEFEIEESSVGK